MQTNKRYYDSKQDMIDEWHLSHATQKWCEARDLIPEAFFWQGRCEVLAEIVEQDDGIHPKDHKPTFKVVENESWQLEIHPND